MDNNPIFLNDPKGDDPPKGFKKWKGANGTDLFVPESTKNLGVFTDDDKNGKINYGSKTLKAKKGEIRRFSIEGVTYRARFKDDGTFNGYWDAKGNQYKNPDISISSGNFSGQELATMNIDFSVQNVPSDGLQIVQIDSYTKVDARYSEMMAEEGMPLNSSGLIPGQYYFKDGKIKYAGEVDGGAGSFYAYQQGGVPSNPNGPYYYSQEELYGALSWNGKSGSINVYDNVSAKSMQKNIKFTTMIVAVNYLGTGKDIVLATYNWGWTDYGRTPLHTSNPLLISNPSARDLFIVNFYYPNYLLIK